MASSKSHVIGYNVGPTFDQFLDDHKYIWGFPRRGVPPMDGYNGKSQL